MLWGGGGRDAGSDSASIDEVGAVLREVGDCSLGFMGALPVGDADAAPALERRLTLQGPTFLTESQGLQTHEGLSGWGKLTTGRGRRGAMKWLLIRGIRPAFDGCAPPGEPGL